MFHSPTTSRSDQSYGEFYAYDLITLPSKSSPQAIPSFFSLGETTLDKPATTTIGFLSRDPIGYVGSPFDLYELLNSSPSFSIDPLGEESAVPSTSGLPYFPWGVPGAPRLPTGRVDDPIAWARWLCPNAGRFGCGRCPSPEDRYGDCQSIPIAQGRNCGQFEANCTRECNRQWFSQACQDECNRATRCCNISIIHQLASCLSAHPTGYPAPNHSITEFWSPGCRNSIGGPVPHIPNGPNPQGVF